MLAGSALLVLAAWSPFALLRMIPAMEVAAANVASQRSTMSAAAGSAGIHSPSGYMRQAMSRHSRTSGYGATGHSISQPGGTTRQPAEAGGAHAGGAAETGPPSGWPSTGGGGSVDPETRRPSSASVPDEPPSSRPAQPRPPADDRRQPPAPPSSPSAHRPASSDPPSPPPPQAPSRPRPQEPPPDRRPPPDRGAT
jgi:hypothetical protein